eukprot:4604572-Pyramimonas_sp.AAC.1
MLRNIAVVREVHHPGAKPRSNPKPSNLKIRTAGRVRHTRHPLHNRGSSALSSAHCRKEARGRCWATPSTDANRVEVRLGRR